METLVLIFVAATSEPTRLPWLDSDPASQPALSMAKEAPRRELIERVVATVERQTITLVDLKRATAIEIAKLTGPAVYMRPWPEGLLEEMRKQLVQRMLLLEEARRYSQPDPTAAEVDSALTTFRAKFPDDRAFNRFLERTTITLDTLKDDLRRTLRVDRFLDFRIRSRIEVSEQDVARYRASKQDELGALADDVVRRRLLDNVFLARTFEYLKERSERSDVRLIGEITDLGFTGTLDP